MKTFAVWVHIEEVDEESDSYTEAAEPQRAGTFETLEQAQARAAQLLDSIGGEQ